MRKYVGKTYKDLVENTTDPHVQYYMNEELDFLRRINNAANRDFIELGAGYGRVGAQLKDEVKNYIGIEINPDMHDDLELLGQKYGNIEAISSNMIHLPEIFQRRKFDRPVVMILQNTFGVIEDGAHENILKAVNEFFKERQGDLIISVLKSELLESQGLDFYATLSQICGNYDPAKSNLAEGIFATDNGYFSKWWKGYEIEDLISNVRGDIAEIFEGYNFYIFRITF